MQQVDILKIKDNISKKHNEFIQNLGCHIDRILAEHNLTMELTFTRIMFICEAFQELKIIDKIKTKKETPARKVYLSKDGYDNYVCVSTNGDKIILDGASYLTSMNGFAQDKIILDGANTDDFDWIKFADELLMVIHGIIYERKEAVETKTFVGKGFIKHG